FGEAFYQLAATITFFFSVVDPLPCIFGAAVILGSIAKCINGIAVTVKVNQGIAKIHIDHVLALGATFVDGIARRENGFFVLIQIQIDSGKTLIKTAFARGLGRFFKNRQGFFGIGALLPGKTQYLQVFTAASDFSFFHAFFNDSRAHERRVGTYIHVSKANQLLFLIQISGKVGQLGGNQLIDALVKLGIHAAQLAPVTETRIVHNQFLKNIHHALVIIALVINDPLQTPPAFFGKVAFGFLLFDGFFHQSQ